MFQYNQNFPLTSEHFYYIHIFSIWIISIVIDVAIMMKMWNIARINQCVRGLASFVEAMNYNDSNPKRHFYEHDEKSLTVYRFS